MKKETNENIEKILGTNIYSAYDISLYSNAKQENITKLENEKFEVKIPLPENLKDKELAVYYITDNGDTEEHVATVRDKYVLFETNHFSTYVLTEKAPGNSAEGDSIEENKGPKDETPNTGRVDVINYVIVATTLAGIGIVALRKKN